MSARREKKAKREGNFDPVLFGATVPSRKPTSKDIAGFKERPDDAVEPKDHETMGDMVKDL